MSENVTQAPAAKSNIPPDLMDGLVRCQELGKQYLSLNEQHNLIGKQMLAINEEIKQQGKELIKVARSANCNAVKIGTTVYRFNCFSETVEVIENVVE